MAVRLNCQQVQRRLRRSDFKCFQLINEALQEATSHVPLGLVVRTVNSI